MMKKLTAALLMAAMLITSLAACGKGNEAPGTTTADAQATGEPTAEATTAAPEADSPYDENGYIKDELPDDLNLGGATINIYIADYNSAYAEDMYAETLTGGQ